MDEKWIEQNDDLLFMYKWIRIGCPLIICKDEDHENDETKEQK